MIPGLHGLALAALACACAAQSQGTPAPTSSEVQQQIQQLTENMARTQAQLEQSQRQLKEMQDQLQALKLQMASQGAVTEPTPVTPEISPALTPATLDEIAERQAMQESQIATHEQTKVETASRYPLKITGMVLLTGFVNTSGVDIPSLPAVAVAGSGSTGLSISQTSLGFDAMGPHLFGAQSYADLRVDFFGSLGSGQSGGIYSGYLSNTALMRLRTAHASLVWRNTTAYFALDRPILSPDTPTSLTSVAEPALAWSGNLWTWNPQLGVTSDLLLTPSKALRFQAALIDTGDAPVSELPYVNATTAAAPTSAELSRWPGVEARIALLGSTMQEGRSHFGVGGYFAPHHTTIGRDFDAWAATADLGIALPGHLELTASAYRGLGLGGLGAGTYKDYLYYTSQTSARVFFRALDDVGGWAQLKEVPSARLQFNAAFGIDNGFSREVRRYVVPGGTVYENLARNQTATANVIFSPSAYLQFSLEYRHLVSFPAIGTPFTTNVIGLAVGYKF